MKALFALQLLLSMAACGQQATWRSRTIENNNLSIELNYNARPIWKVTSENLSTPNADTLVEVFDEKGTRLFRFVVPNRVKQCDHTWVDVVQDTLVITIAELMALIDGAAPPEFETSGDIICIQCKLTKKKVVHNKYVKEMMLEGDSYLQPRMPHQNSTTYSSYTDIAHAHYASALISNFQRDTATLDIVSFHYNQRMKHTKLVLVPNGNLLQKWFFWVPGDLPSLGFNEKKLLVRHLEMEDPHFFFKSKRYELIAAEPDQR